MLVQSLDIGAPKADGFSRCLGQNTGKLSSAPWWVRQLGRSQMINFVSRPDFLVCELELLPSAPVNFWRRRGLPVLVWPVRSPDEERRAREFGDNIIFSGYNPRPKGNRTRVRALEEHERSSQ